jgi:hypothetical protein
VPIRLLKNMTTTYTQEFQTVDLIVNSKARTCGVDAFALSLIKAERQMRRLVTHLIYLFPSFSRSDIPRLREVLASNGQVYFDGVVEGFDAIYPRSVSNLVGNDYPRLRKRMQEATDQRRKIFHGQLTSKNLTRRDLLALVQDIRTWCSSLACSAHTEFGYDGFSRNSFQKSTVPDLWRRFKVQITTVEEYGDFIRKNMQRSQLKRSPKGKPASQF